MLVGKVDHHEGHIEVIQTYAHFQDELHELPCLRAEVTISLKVIIRERSDVFTQLLSNCLELLLVLVDQAKAKCDFLNIGLQI